MSDTEGNKKRLDSTPQPIFLERKAFDGKNSEIREHHYPDGSRFVVTRLGSRKGGFTFEEAQTISQRVARYHKELTDLGVPVPELKSMYVEYEPSIDRSVVVKSSPWAGHELYSIIRTADVEKDLEYVESLVRKIAKILGLLYKDRIDDWHTKVGIDPHTSNFVVNHKGEVSYVDLFPPRIRENGTPLVEWPAPLSKEGFELGYFKHFDMRGIILTTIQHLSRAKPELSEYFKEVILSEFKTLIPPTLFNPFVDELMKTPFMSAREHLRERNIDTLHNLIGSTPTAIVFETPYTASALREIALAFATHGHMNGDELDAFFLASHCEDTLPSETTESLIKTLKEVLAQVT